ncbi:MAG TPA: type II toxin-antitoxin system RelE/ParE family toxin [Steroidobacteraceae bacterium]|nr:type II toxin-antitoxin system RelE/ParE family toxin [Steroidobacteraceae bacterium]
MSPPVKVTDQPKCAIKPAREYEDWFAGLDKAVKTEAIAKIKLLRLTGSDCPRPHADKLRYTGKVLPDPRELRFSVDGDPWRILYVFHDGVAVLLAGGCKGGSGKEADFYARLFHDGETVFKAYKARLAAAKLKGGPGKK